MKEDEKNKGDTRGTKYFSEMQRPTELWEACGRGGEALWEPEGSRTSQETPKNQ